MHSHTSSTHQLSCSYWFISYNSRDIFSLPNGMQGLRHRAPLRRQSTGGLARAWHVFKLVMETQISTALVQPPKRGNEKGQRSPCTAVSPSLSSYSRLSIHQCSRQVSLSVLVVGIYSVQREWMCPGQVACNLLLSEQHWPVFLFFSPSQYCTILLNGYSPEWGGTDVTGMTFVVKM